MKIGAVLINVEVPTELLPRSLALVCCVVRRSDKKVIDVAVVERPSLHHWFEGRRNRFSVIDNMFIVSATSVLGEVIDVDVSELKDTTKAQLN